jgi:protein TonB
MIALAAEDVADLRRWIISAAVVVLAHGAIAAGMMRWREAIEPAEPAGAIVIDFAPILEGPAAPPTEIPPGPEQVMAEATPEQKVEQQPVEETPPEVKPAPNPELTVEPPKEIKQETTEAPRIPAPTTSAPQSMPLQTAAIPAAPTQGRLNPNNSTAIPTWRTQIVALLERNKRYPPAAQSRHEHGIAQVFFSLDRQGRVLDSRIVRSAGAAVLDEEALALLNRAQPFPPPPPELAGERINLTVPIRFNLK